MTNDLRVGTALIKFEIYLVYLASSTSRLELDSRSAVQPARLHVEMTRSQSFPASSVPNDHVNHVKFLPSPLQQSPGGSSVNLPLMADSARRSIAFILVCLRSLPALRWQLNPWRPKWVTKVPYKKMWGSQTAAPNSNEMVDDEETEFILRCCVEQCIRLWSLQWPRNVRCQSVGNNLAHRV